MPPRLPALESRRVLEACCRHANFTRAAAELGVTPAAVSLRIRDLEAELGAKLFRRSGPRVEPTAAATALLPHDDWPLWFREAGAEGLNLHFYADDYPTHELDATAAIAGAGVALLSPIIFGPLIRAGKLVQPFAHVTRGPSWHYALLDPRETRPQMRRFCAWLEQEALGGKAA